MARIKSITRRRINGQRLYNLAVDGDESYVANGLVVHNCKSYIVPNLVNKKNPKVDPTGLQPSDPALDKYVTLSDRLAGADYEKRMIDDTTEEHTYSRDGKPFHKVQVKYSDNTRREIISTKGEKIGTPAV